ncbi:MAG: aminodeoxychorismate synthase component I [Planctomycetota bacterium]
MPLEERVLDGESELDVNGIRAGLAKLPSCALLESANGFGDLGQFSIFAAFPRGVFEISADQWRLSESWPGERPEPSLSPFQALRSLLKQTAIKQKSKHVFCGGWIGYLGYDLAPLLERVPRRNAKVDTAPDLHLAYYDTFVLQDRIRNRFDVVGVDRFEEGEVRRRQRLERLLDTISSATPIDDEDATPLVASAPISDFTPDEYCHAVERILEYIRAGDIFQANLSQRLSAPWKGNVESLYGRSISLSPAPFASLLRHGDWAVVSTSPERFLKVEPDGWVETRPIKGTRARGRDKIHDLLLRAELGASPKDRAELTMIVDLERNDLGRVCEYGSVNVSGHAVVESFSNVHHLVSTVRGKLHPNRDVVDLLGASFPGGSITGAPKIRAMEIIDELERCRRGVYTGAIGYLSDHGRADFNIAIRTIVVDGKTATYHVGGGIVADSNPVAEYRETMIKGERLRAILMGEN